MRQFHHTDDDGKQWIYPHCDQVSRHASWEITTPWPDGQQYYADTTALADACHSLRAYMLDQHRRRDAELRVVWISPFPTGPRTLNRDR